MDRKRSLFGQSSSGIPKPASRPSAYSAYDSGIPKPSARTTQGPGRQSAGLSRPSGFGPFSAVKSASSARKSIFMSARKSHTPQTGRPSFNPSSVTSTASRQSIGGQRSVQEDRPISDISYHKHCVAKLNDFFQRTGQPALPPRFYASPSSSDIRRVFEVLFRQIGMNLNQIAQPPKSWDQEIPNIMRSLGYKYTIAKKFIVSSTSNHSKGQLFGLFEWLVDAVSYNSRSGLDHVLYQGEAPVDVPLELLKIVLFNETDAREGKLSQIGEALYGTEEQHRAMIDDELAIQNEIEGLNQEIQQVETMRKLHSELESECAKFQKYAEEIAEQLETHRETAGVDLPILKQNITATEALIQQTLAQKDRIMSQLNEQEFGQEDLKWARERQQQLKEEAAKETKAIEEQKRSLRDVRLTVKQDEDKLFKMQSDLHSLLMSLKEAVLSPSISPYVQQIKELLQEKQLESVTAFLIQPIALTPVASGKRIQLQKLVQDYKMQLLQQTVMLEGNVMTSSEQKAKDLQTAIADKEKSIQELKDKMSALNQEIEADRIEATHEHTRLKNEYETNQTFLKELGEKLKKSEAETADRVQKLTEAVAKQEADLKNLQSTRVKWFREYTSREKDILGQIQNRVTEKLVDVKSYRDSLDHETTRQKARIEKLHKKISDYKASKLAKK